jgi:hypothetical protein
MGLFSAPVGRQHIGSAAQPGSAQSRTPSQSLSSPSKQAMPASSRAVGMHMTQRGSARQSVSRQSTAPSPSSSTRLPQSSGRRVATLSWKAPLDAENPSTTMK